MSSYSRANILLQLPSGRQLQVHDLKRELEKLNESTKGKKDELSERLRIALFALVGPKDKLLFMNKELSALNDYKVKPLKARLAARKLKMAGTKAVLAARLRDAITKEGQKLKRETLEKENRARQHQQQAAAARAQIREMAGQGTRQLQSPAVGLASASRQQIQQPASVRVQNRAAFVSPALVSPSNISAEQRARMEMNRKRALEIKAAKAAKQQENERKRQKLIQKPLRQAAGVQLSQEQIEIVNLAEPPSSPATSTNNNGGRLIRITAAAGTGKTTTLISLALRCIDLGHRHLTYVTFTKAAAADGERRIRSVLSDQEATTTQVEASTLHACAMRLVKDADETDDGVEDSKRLTDDEGIKKIIKQVCDKQIEDYLKKAYAFISNKAGLEDNASNIRSKRDNARNQVIYFIWKSLVTFCQSRMTEERMTDGNNTYRHYYPVKLYHKADADGEKAGFPPDHYSEPSVYKFYVDMAMVVWSHILQHKVKAYGTEMKRAQLEEIRIPGTSVLLIDECQDLDACQVDWLAKQTNYGAHVYFVGDAAQTIYGFRGAKSKFVMSLDNAIDRSLTTSWRFGTPIAQVANTVLFAKEYSPQTTNDERNRTWKPYRVTGAAIHTSCVTTESFLNQWKERPLTLIARTNATLLFKVMDLLGMSHLINSNEDEDGEGGVGSSVPTVTPDSDDDESQIKFDFPKIHINGKGESSGLKKWRIATKQVEHLFNLYKSGNGGAPLPEDRFREFAGQTVTWNTFVKDVENRELSQYSQTIKIVQSFKDNTPEAMQVFKHEVLDKNFKADEADIILSTCHSAKGMEWDCVELCDDFVNLAKYNDDGQLRRDVAALTKSGSLPEEKNASTSKAKPRKAWRFGVKGFGDDLNLLYVAVTRAKKKLCIPPSLRALYEEFDMFDAYVQGWQKVVDESGENASTSQDVAHLKADRKLSKKDICNIYFDLCMPLRAEACLGRTDKFIGTLVPMLSSDEDMSGNTTCSIVEVSPVKIESSSSETVEENAAITATGDAAMDTSQSDEALEGVSIYRAGNSGFGISLGLTDDGRPAVLSLKEGGAAAEQGSLNPGDVVLKINGKSVRGWTMAMITNEVKGTDHSLPLLLDVARPCL